MIQNCHKLQLTFKKCIACALIKGKEWIIVQRAKTPNVLQMNIRAYFTKKSRFQFQSHLWLETIFCYLIWSKLTIVRKRGQMQFTRLRQKGVKCCQMLCLSCLLHRRIWSTFAFSLYDMNERGRGGNWTTASNFLLYGVYDILRQQNFNLDIIKKVRMRKKKFNFLRHTFWQQWWMQQLLENLRTMKRFRFQVLYVVRWRYVFWNMKGARDLIDKSS